MKKILWLLSMSILLAGCSSKNETADKEKVPEVTRDSIVIVQTAADSTSVLELLKKEHEVIDVSSAMGTFIKGIDSVENSRYTFWLYSVNDTMASVAADDRIVTEGDVVRWHYRQNGPENQSDSTK